MLSIVMPLTGIGVKLSSSVCIYIFQMFVKPHFFFLPLSAGLSLSSRLSEALKAHALHHAFFDKLSSGLEPQTIKEWEEAVKAWEDDQTKPNPFEDFKKSVYIFFR